MRRKNHILSLINLINEHFCNFLQKDFAPKLVKWQLIEESVRFSYTSRYFESFHPNISNLEKSLCGSSYIFEVDIVKKFELAAIVHKPDPRNGHYSSRALRVKSN